MNVDVIIVLHPYPMFILGIQYIQTNESIKMHTTMRNENSVKKLNLM